MPNEYACSKFHSGKDKGDLDGKAKRDVRYSGAYDRIGEAPMTFHCFFEQSGTFKNEFRKLGYEAYDYDILNDFGETDYKIDLFKEIETAYGGGL